MSPSKLWHAIPSWAWHEAASLAHPCPLRLQSTQGWPCSLTEVCVGLQAVSRMARSTCWVPELPHRSSPPLHSLADGDGAAAECCLTEMNLQRRCCLQHQARAPPALLVAAACLNTRESHQPGRSNGRGASSKLIARPCCCVSPGAAQLVRVSLCSGSAACECCCSEAMTAHGPYLLYGL